MEGFLNLAFWGGVLVVVALGLWGLIVLRKKFFPSELDLQEQQHQQQRTAAPLRSQPAPQPVPVSRPAPVAPVAATSQLPVVQLQALASALNIAVIGPKDSGKTTTLTALLRMRQGYALALDPHDEPNKWPCEVVGGGLRFDDIHMRLLVAYETMRQRYTASAHGKRPQTEYQMPIWRLSLVGDEWGGISAELPDVRGTSSRAPVAGAGTLLGKLLAQGRKVGIGLLVAAHDDTAAQLGLEGEMGLVQCFDYMIYLRGQATNNTNIPSEVRQAAGRMTWPAVVRDTSRNAWSLLKIDNQAQCFLPSAAHAAMPPDFAAEVYAREAEQDNVLAGLLAGVPHQSGGVMTQNSGVPHSGAVRAAGVGVVTPVQEAETATPHGGHTATPTPAHESQVITPDELRRLVYAVELHRGGMSMTPALCKAFDTKKGSTNPRWLRARWLWDQAMTTEDTAVEDDDQTDVGNVTRLSRIA